MKPKLESLLENFRERGAGERWESREESDGYRDGHDALAPLLTKAISALACEVQFHGSKPAVKIIEEIFSALAQGTEARGEGEKNL